MKKSRGARTEAEAQVRSLMESSLVLSHTDLKRAKAEALLARRIRLKFNIRLDESLKRYTCRGCKGLLVPGVNARVRLGHGKQTVIRITCSDCGHVNRKIVETI